MTEGAADEIRIDGYDSFERIGIGGFSTVYRARQIRFNRIVAVKVLALELRDNPSRDRFTHETRVAGPLSDHPNVVHVLDSGFTDHGLPYIASELMERGSLADQLARNGPASLEDTLRVGVKIAGAVASMHALDLVHRDIKPQNILLSGFGEPGLCDFGIATVLAGRAATTGTFSSTPVHAAPEVLEGKGARPATDVWSLASTLYSMLAGRAPFEGEPDEGLYPLMRRILEQDVPPIGRDDVPSDVEQVLARAMAKSPDQRYPSAIAFGRALQDLQRQHGLTVTEMIAPREGVPTVQAPAGHELTRSRPTVALAASGVAELDASEPVAAAEPVEPVIPAEPVIRAEPFIPAVPVVPVIPVVPPVPVTAAAPDSPGSRATVAPTPLAPPMPAPIAAPDQPSAAMPPSMPPPMPPPMPPSAAPPMPPSAPPPATAGPSPLAGFPAAAPPKKRGLLLAFGVVVVVAVVAAAAIVLTRPKQNDATGAGGTGGAGGASGTTIPPAHATVGPGCHAPAPPSPAPPPSAPQQGGTLHVGLADESEGFEPTRGLTASGQLVATAIYDPLAQLNDQGVVEPYLAAAIDHNDDYTQYTVTLRPNVKFHDGSPFDAKAVEANWAVSRNNKLTGRAFAEIKDIKVPDDLHIVVDMTQPWPTFPLVLAGQFGFIESPAVLGTPAAGKKPVGTGPYMYKDWRPGQAFVVTKNPSYWQQGDAAPHLDTIEFRPITDDLARVAAYEAGELDMIIASDTDAIDKLKAKAPVTTTVSAVNFVTLNTAREPFNDPSARRAVALATDQTALAKRLRSDLVEPLTSPFPSDNPWCVDDTGAPGFDLAQAKALAADYEKRNGRPITFNLDAPSTADGPALANALVDQWSQAGIKVTFAQYERTKFVFNLVGGNYQAGVHTLRSLRDPDNFYDWFHSSPDPGDGLNLNLSRISDPAIDKVLDIGRQSTDLAERKSAYAELVRLLNKDLPFIWLYATPQAIVAHDFVRGVDSLTTPLRPGARPWSSDVWISN